MTRNTARIAHLTTQRKVLRDRSEWTRTGPHFARNEESRNGDDGMRCVNQDVGKRADDMGMAHDIDDDIGGIKHTKKPEVSTGRARSDQAADERQSPETQMSNVYESGHAEQSKHLSIWGHDPRNVIERVNR